jgi:hypothetical protein
MFKRYAVGLLMVGLVGVSLFMVSITGCGKTSSETVLQATLNDVTTVGTSEVTLSGSIKYAGGVVDLNLNAVIISGEAVSLGGSSFKVRVGKDVGTITGLSTVEFTLPVITNRPMDIVFILDNTGSMSGAITGSKDSIIAFASSLEAGGADARFGLVTFGDSATHPTPSGSIAAEGGFDDGNYYPRPVKDFGNAVALQSVLSAETYAEGGSDLPENPLDAIMYAYNHFTWRSAAQKIFVVITDINAHQNILTDTSTDNKCTTSGEAVVSSLIGRAVIYAVSPNFTISQSPYLDVRRLADGLGEGRAVSLSNTGGKWIQFQSLGFDLTTLGISETVTKAFTLRFNYSLDAGTWYIYLQVDTDNDGIFDSNMLIKLTIAGSSSVAYSTFGKPAAMDVKVLQPDDGKARPNK